MAFYNYILLVVLIFLIAFLYISHRRKRIENVLFKRALNIFTMIAIVFIILAIVLFPDLGRVKTTGEYIYSSCVLELTDISRIESFKNDGSP